MTKALAKDSAERYQTINDFALDLKTLKQELEFKARLEVSGQPVPSTRTGLAVSLPARHTVGREKERAELRAGFESAVGGCGLLLGVAGEPGIGKTTLVEDFLAELNTSKRPCTISSTASIISLISNLEARDDPAVLIMQPRSAPGEGTRPTSASKRVVVGRVPSPGGSV